MARETKVGLLAGLAFIVCFAVILANRGRNGPTGLADSILTNTGVNVPVSPPRASGSASANNAHARSATPARTPSSPPSRGPASPRMVDATPASGSELPDDQMAGAEARTAPPSGAFGVQPIGSATGLRTAGVDPNREALERLLASRLQPPPGSPATSETVVPARESASPAASPSNGTIPPVITGRTDSTSVHRGAGPPPRAPSTGSPSEAVGPGGTGGRRYTVGAGDTLSSIAAAHYGTKSHRTVQAIFEANRGVLAHPDEVKVGMSLVLPSLFEATAVGGEASRIAVAPPTNPVAAVKPSGDVRDSARVAEGVRWYQVKKNDRYASIAREQLGDESRWKEIYELNKDKFPDAGRIREGVRIRLPSADATAERSARR